MQILLKLFLLLININQDTVLTFIENEETNNYLTLNFDINLLSTQISFETLTLIFQEILERYQSGLSLIDIENILFFITLIRFIILVNCYNIKTAFYISSISLFAGFLWYTHLKDLYNWYGEMLTYNRLTSQFGQDALNEDYILQATRQNQMYFEFINQNPLNFLKSAFINASEKNGYRHDPISMIVTGITKPYKLQIENCYYYVYDYVLPVTWKLIGTQLRELGPLILYVWMVRLNKKYCPYLIRWHWTYLVVGSIFETEFIRILYRLFSYYNQILIPQARFAEAMIIEQFFALIVTTHYFLICLGMLHAICGQYFYIPFFTENTEIHIGIRPKNDIYSEGYTAWQDDRTKQLERMTKNRKLFLFGHLGWQWLEYNYPIKNITRYFHRHYKQKKRFQKLIRKFKNWILRN